LRAERKEFRQVGTIGAVRVAIAVSNTPYRGREAIAVAPSSPAAIATGQPQMPDQLDLAQRREVEALRRRDAEVRQHEQSHLVAAGPYVKGGPRYEYKTGPDGRRYAVDGEVDIDTTPVPSSPEATIEKARAVRRAALAPGRPSGQDRAVAAAAQQMEYEATQELARKRAEEAQGENTPPGEPSQDTRSPPVDISA
jgi:hypothetical protein